MERSPRQQSAEVFYNSQSSYLSYMALSLLGEDLPSFALAQSQTSGGKIEKMEMIFWRKRL